jgi:hypothetical protein
MPFLRGIICKLAERLCALIILCPSAVPLLAASSAALSLAPIDIIETERLCVLPDAEAFECPAVHDPGPGGDRPVPTGALNESAGRWPLDCGGGRGLKVLLFLACAIGGFLCLSPPARKPFVDGGCNRVLGGGGVEATFLKVIWHSTSSPANTVCSVHCTKTLMLVDGVDMS